VQALRGGRDSGGRTEKGLLRRGNGGRSVLRTAIVNLIGVRGLAVTTAVVLAVCLGMPRRFGMRGSGKAAATRCSQPGSPPMPGAKNWWHGFLLSAVIVCSRPTVGQLALQACRAARPGSASSGQGLHGIPGAEGGRERQASVAALQKRLLRGTAGSPGRAGPNRRRRDSRNPRHVIRKSAHP